MDFLEVEYLIILLKFINIGLLFLSFLLFLLFFFIIYFKRIKNNLPPGEIILLSSSPGTLMNRLSKHYGIQKISTVRASRVDYYTQHKISVWRNHLG